MARYQYIILARAKQGRVEEFTDWYDDRHIVDVLKVEGVVAARRYEPLFHKVIDLGIEGWHSVAVYDIESDDPQSVVDSISAKARTPEMPVSDAMERTGLIQVLVREMVSLEK